MTRGPIEALHGGEEEEPRGVKAWDRYMRHAEELEAQRAAEDEQARIRAQASEPPPAAPPERGRTGGSLAGAMAAAAGAAAAGLARLLHETPEEKDMEALEAMQAETLARLELPTMADSAWAAQRASDASDPAGLLAGKELADARHFEGKEQDPAAARTLDGPRPAPDWVAPTRKGADGDPAPRRDQGR
jgi:hypothetical protein